MNRILVTGSTGNVGRHVVDQLTAAAARFRAMTRDPDAAGLPAGVEVVPGDLTVPESLDPSLRETDTVFLVWVAPPEAIAGALERIATHARRIVYLTAPLKTPHPFFRSSEWTWTNRFGRRRSQQEPGSAAESGHRA
jgi:nucleoside-diphosphate-sugar epimerase